MRAEVLGSTSAAWSPPDVSGHVETHLLIEPWANSRKQRVTSAAWEAGNRCSGQKRSPREMQPPLESYPMQRFSLQVLTPSSQHSRQVKACFKAKPRL